MRAWSTVMLDPRTALLRILSNLDQAIAKTEETIRDTESDDARRLAIDTRAELKDCELQAQAALKQCMQ